MSDNKLDASRSWLCTINNPLDHGFDRSRIKDVLDKGAKLRYYCISDEVGEKGTPHVHFFVIWDAPMRFKTLQNKFVSVNENGEEKSCVHIDLPNGTPDQCRDYVFKEGKWLNDPKGETNVRESHEEYGECPVYRQGSRTDLSGLYDLIKSGKSNYEILETDPNLMKYVDRIDKVRKTIQSESVKNLWRNVSVTYVWGKTGSGKTRSVMEEYGYSNVYRVTDYLHPFDGYAGQDVILFEEFRSSLRIEDMLKYLDGYPVELSCRYSNQQALFTKVYFCTNIDLRQQYRNIQADEPETWKAFLRRIDKVKVYENENIVECLSCADYMNGNPFDHPERYDWIQVDFDTFIMA